MGWSRYSPAFSGADDLLTGAPPNIADPIPYVRFPFVADGLLLTWVSLRKETSVAMDPRGLYPDRANISKNPVAAASAADC